MSGNAMADRQMPNKSRFGELFTTYLSLPLSSPRLKSLFWLQAHLSAIEETIFSI